MDCTKRNNMEIFKFEKEVLTNHIRYDLYTFDKVKKPLDYICETLEKNGHSIKLTSLSKIDLGKVKEKEGKNYNWSVVNYKNVRLLIRTYKQHLTIYTRVFKKEKKYDQYEYGAFTFNTNLDMFKGTDKQHDSLMDEMYDNPFMMLNKCAKQLFEVLIERGAYWVWNSACWKTPDLVEVKLAYEKEIIHSLDIFAFCMEEIDHLHCHLYAENTMFEKLPELKKRVGKDFDHQYKIKSVETKVKNGYYHGAGVLLEDKKDKKNTSFKDVYTLTRWYHDNVFVEKKKPSVIEGS